VAKTHFLKIEQVWWERVRSGEKTCEVRLNDRDFQTGDAIRFEVDGSYVHIIDPTKNALRGDQSGN